MASTRSLSIDEVRSLTIFPSEYRSKRYLRLDTSGSEPELSWKLTMVNASGEITRQLDGGSLKAMEELYGTVYPLRFIGSFDEGKLVGLATWKFEEWNSTTFLCDIRVKEAHRNQGIAGRLLEDLQWASMRLDARGILLETQNTNVPAVEFYQKRGFRLVGFNTSTYGEPNRCGVDVALFFFLSLGG